MVVDGKSYKLKLSMNAAATLQKKTGKKIGQLLQEVGGLDFVVIRQLVWLLLQKYHADQFKTEEAAGDFIDDAGGISGFFAALEELSNLNANEAKLTEVATGKADPLPAQAGTSESSSSSSGDSV